MAVFTFKPSDEPTMYDYATMQWANKAANDSVTATIDALCFNWKLDPTLSPILYMEDRKGNPADGAGHKVWFFEHAVLMNLEVLPPGSTMGHYGAAHDKLVIRVSAQYPKVIASAKVITVGIPMEKYESDLQHWRIAGVKRSTQEHKSRIHYELLLVRGENSEKATGATTAMIAVPYLSLLEDCPKDVWSSDPLPLIKYEAEVSWGLYADGKLLETFNHRKKGEARFFTHPAMKTSETSELWSLTAGGEKHTLVVKRPA